MASKVDANLEWKDHLVYYVQICIREQKIKKRNSISYINI
jgi:hypothetical protein